MDHPLPDSTQQTLQEWHRGHPERRIAGVCTTIARQLDLPLPIVRSGFVLAALVPGLQGIGLSLYGAVWALTPSAPGEPTLLDRVAAAISDLFGSDHSDDIFDDAENDARFR